MMPFLQHKKRKIYVEQLPYYQSAFKIFAPLQVRIRWYDAGKKALSWASLRIFQMRSGETLREGSLSLEAALVLPLFLFACFCLMMPMRMMDRQRQIQAAVEAVGEEVSQYAYAARRLEGENPETVDLSRGEGNRGNESALSLLSQAYIMAAVLGRIDLDWVEGVSFAGTEIGPEDKVHIVMSYRMRLPFSVLGLESLPFSTVCSRRMWTGALGNRWEQAGGGAETGEEIVYIGKTSSRYHRRRDCHYLANDLKAVPAAGIEALRNREGKRYYACGVCKGESGTVYVSEYGTSYHSSPNCRSLISYVEAVPISQVRRMGACSYCGGG